MPPQLPIQDRRWTTDFRALAAADPDFAPYLLPSTRSINFDNPDAVRQLTISLLRNWFGLEVDLPTNRLCPAIPGRIAYVEWVHQLVQSSDRSLSLDDGGGDGQHDRPVHGLDIGVGASCVYPLISTAIYPSWTMIGTEIDDTNYASAHRNVTNNKLQDRISLVHTAPQDPLFHPSIVGTRSNAPPLDFCMCNPPFFESRAEMAATYTTKQELPSAVCTGADVEMVGDGGDLGFAIRILDESEGNKEVSQWFTCLFGKLSSLHSFVAELRKREISNWTVACLDAGGKTRRWSVGWSFGLWRPSQVSTINGWKEI